MSKGRVVDCMHAAEPHTAQVARPACGSGYVACMRQRLRGMSATPLGSLDVGHAARSSQASAARPVRLQPVLEGLLKAGINETDSSPPQHDQIADVAVQQHSDQDPPAHTRTRPGAAWTISVPQSRAGKRPASLEEDVPLRKAAAARLVKEQAAPGSAGLPRSPRPRPGLAPSVNSSRPGSISSADGAASLIVASTLQTSSRGAHTDPVLQASRQSACTDNSCRNSSGHVALGDSVTWPCQPVNAQGAGMAYKLQQQPQLPCTAAQGGMRVWSNAAAEQQETCGDDAEGGVAAHSEDLHTHMREDRLAGCLNHCMPLTAVQPCRVASQSGADATVRLRASFAFEAAAEDVARCQVPAAASVAPAAHADHDPCHRPQAAGLPPPLPGTWRPAASAATAVGQQGDGEAAAGISAAPPSAADQQLLPVERTATRTSDAVPDSPTAARPSGTTTRTDVSRDVLDQAIQLMQAIVSGGQAGQQGNVDDPEAGDNASPRAVAPPLRAVTG